ncbi:valyl-tRNA synthetase [Culex quinquefasciatus]|uniref:Valyl-tRNA synthetase n=1 Tax=Culex quinquefasciatus TaxID=7176 RepID=B0WHT2_CULQU|nr:valyl-tRNA synthetase [Culex quinquefasciatus]|eukprot:XP_001848266.1 valyl-tRNA synthetase [Culex quinquefasciatus]
MRKGHLLPLVEVNDCKGRILDGFGHFTDLPRYEARVKMMDYLTNVSLPLPLPSLTEHLPLLLSQVEKGARGFFSRNVQVRLMDPAYLAPYVSCIRSEDFAFLTSFRVDQKCTNRGSFPASETKWSGMISN